MQKPAHDPHRINFKEPGTTGRRVPGLKTMCFISIAYQVLAQAKKLFNYDNDT